MKSQFAPALVRRVACLLVCTFLLTVQSLSSSPPSPTQSGEIPLLTPKSHYEQFKPGMSGLPLLAEVLKGGDPTTQQFVSNLASGLPKGVGLADVNLQGLVRVVGLPDKPLSSK